MLGKVTGLEFSSHFDQIRLHSIPRENISSLARTEGKHDMVAWLSSASLQGISEAREHVHLRETRTQLLGDFRQTSDFVCMCNVRHQ